MKNLLIASILVLGFQIAQAQNPTSTAPGTTTRPATKTEAKPAMKTEAKPAATTGTGTRSTETKQAPKTETKSDMSTDQTMDSREHVCSATCKDGKHVYAHGEKGHKCTSACHTKKPTKTSTAAKTKTATEEAPRKMK